MKNHMFLLTLKNIALISMAYIESILLGISLAAIPGPIFFEVLRRTLTNGLLSGVLLAVGEFLANFLILMLTFLGVYQFLLVGWVKSALFVFGGAILAWIGANALKIKKEDVEAISIKEFSKSNSLLTGFALATTSPLTIVVWISVGGAYLAQYSSKVIAFINISLLALGVMLFFFALAMLVHITRHKISARYVLLSSKIFGVILIGYGAYFLYRFISVL